jgi:hypothetical protein
MNAVAVNGATVSSVAHELGHGKFLLKHPFDKDYKIPASSTDYNVPQFSDSELIQKSINLQHEK